MYDNWQVIRLSACIHGDGCSLHLMAKVHLFIYTLSHWLQIVVHSCLPDFTQGEVLSREGAIWKKGHRLPGNGTLPGKLWFFCLCPDWYTRCFYEAVKISAGSTYGVRCASSDNQRAADGVVEAVVRMRCSAMENSKQANVYNVCLTK